MHDFVPEEMINFVIERGTAVVFHEQINHLNPTLIKGAYYVHGGNNAPPLQAMIV